MRKTAFAILSLVAFAASAGEWHGRADGELPAPCEGVSLRKYILEEPRQMTAFVVRVDLTNPGIGFAVTGRSQEWGEPLDGGKKGMFRKETERETTMDFMARRRSSGENVVLAVNTTPWGPFPGPADVDFRDPVGWVVSNGIEVSAPKDDEAMLVIRKDGTAEITSSVPPLDEVAFATSGFGLILTNGLDCATSWSVRDAKKGGHPPRTAFGLTADRKTLVILVVDGRQPGYSEGASLDDLRMLMRREGVTDAVNMDGGGSTSLVVLDEETNRPVMLNHHKGGGIRKNAVHFGIVSGLVQSDGVRRLEECFMSPPDSAKPYVFYIMMNGNVTTEGVTCDFEALAKAGIGGVQIFDKGGNYSSGTLKFNTPEWFDLMRHAASEAKRLGLEMCVANCSGWANSGGPWNMPSNGMKKVVFSETEVKGPSAFTGKLPRTQDDNGFHEDIAVLAYKVPKAENAAYPDVNVDLSGNVGTLSSDVPFMVQGVSFRLDFPAGWTVASTAMVEISEDGVNFSELEKFTAHLSILGVPDFSLRYHPFKDSVTAKAIRVSFESESSLTLAELKPELKLRISDLDAKKFDVRRYGSMRLADDPQERAASVVRCKLERDSAIALPEQVIAKDGIVDLTSRLKEDGTLSWDVPEGEWIIARFGYICNGKCNFPASENGKGLEVDKLSATALDWHFSNYAGRLCEKLGSLAVDVAAGLRSILVDSYEVGTQNWTQGFEKKFEARRGYSPLPWLPALTGRVIGSVDETERFLYDFRRTIADLFAENYSAHMAKLCHRHGLTLAVEPYGNCPADNYDYGEAADMPMAEFWSNALEGEHGTATGCAKFAASLAHVWGRRFAGAESFSARPDRGGRWVTTPFSIKAQCDRVYALGINRIIYHRTTHQPWPGDKYLPGMTMGRWGMHLDRTQTWWPIAHAWLGYQSRCQWMLQEGTSVADVLFYAGENVPNQTDFLGGAEAEAMRLPYGYASDVCSLRALEKMRVVNGRIVAPGGVSYALLSLPPHDMMSERALAAIERLAESGAKICGLVKPVRTPGLADYPQADSRIQSEATRIWAKGVMECSAAEALSRRGIAPDFDSTETADDTGAVFIHRRMPGADWYFVALNNEKPKRFTVSFRHTGCIPEIWDAETGTIADATDWRVGKTRTFVTLDFKPNGSAFVVFRKPGSPKARFGANAAEPLASVPVEGAWRVTFPVDWYTGGSAVKELTFDRLEDWTKNDDPDVRYFSGTAVYKCKIENEKCKIGESGNGGRVVLDLGDVRNFAVVTVNGREYSPLWRPPYRVDITDALEGDTADVEIRVTNLWPNRLIGDERDFPDDCEWKPLSKIPGMGRSIAEFPQWVKDGEKSPVGRHTFTTWKHWTAQDALLPSGLIGPVTIETARSQTP